MKPKIYLWTLLCAIIMGIGFSSCDKKSDDTIQYPKNVIQVGLNEPVYTTFALCSIRSEIEELYSYRLTCYAGITAEQIASNITVTTPLAMMYLQLYNTDSTMLPTGIYPLRTTGASSTLFSGKVIYYPNGNDNETYQEWIIDQGSVVVTSSDGDYHITFKGTSNDSVSLYMNYNGVLTYNL